MFKTLFIHIPKNAGISVSKNCPAIPVSEGLISADVKNEIQNRNPIFYRDFIKHVPYYHLDKQVLSQSDRVMAIVRNPWSRLVSMYHYVDRIRPDTISTSYDQKKISFDEYLNRMDNFEMSPFHYCNHPYDQWGNQLDWIPEHIDILRYENLQEDIQSYFGNNVQLTKENVGNYEKDYKEHYNEEQKEKVARWFNRDIERWGFTFESGATKNYWKEIK